MSCRKCGMSWRPPKNIIYKKGMCIPCYYTEHDLLADTTKNLDEWLK